MNAPTWITLINWIGDKVGTLNLVYVSVLRLNEFSSQIESTDTSRNIITKLYTIALSIPPSLLTSASLVMAVKSQLQIPSQGS